MLLADGIDPFAGLYHQWPWLVVAVSIGRWLALRADKVVDRHICYLDSSDRRENERVVTDKQLAVALASISDELKDFGGKLSDIKEAKFECPVSRTYPEGAQVSFKPLKEAG